ncbi:MAG: dihydrofolate reductase family protein [Reichenbachiella sp.]|uniref:dihydrofolate reductase family protein n=1 Tax=Reichenbachiella sp. TaxID=2184521 RepID=UPI00326315EB
MRRLKLFIATSIDGFIARKDGSLDWLDDIPNPDKLDYGYFKFYDSIDTLLMGRKTYNEVLGFGVEWPYPDSKTYVISSGPVDIKTENTFYIQKPLAETVKALMTEPGKDIWVVGGGELISSMLSLDLIDEMLITITPVILGAGIPLFPSQPKETKFDLINTEAFDTGFVNLTYKKHV